MAIKEDITLIVKLKFSLYHGITLPLEADLSFKGYTVLA